MGYWFLGISIFSFALSNCLWPLTLKRLSFLQAIILRSFISSLLFASLVCLSLVSEVSLIALEPMHAEKSFSLIGIAKAIALSAYSYFGLYFFVKSLHEEKVSIAVPISSISAFFGVLVSVIVMGESITSTVVIAFVLFTVGVSLIDNGAYQKVKLSKGVKYNLVAAFFWGTSFALFVYPIKEVGVLVFSFILEVTVCACSILLYYRGKRKWFLSLKEINLTITLLAVLGFCGVIFYNFSISKLPISFVSTLGIITPSVSVLLAVIFFKERMKPLQTIGILFILFGLIALHLLKT